MMDLMEIVHAMSALAGIAMIMLGSAWLKQFLKAGF